MCLQQESQVATPIGVRCAAVAFRHKWVITGLGAILMSEQGFNRSVDVKNPGRTQGMLNEFIWLAYPVPPGNQHTL